MFQLKLPWHAIIFSLEGVLFHWGNILTCNFHMQLEKLLSKRNFGASFCCLCVQTFIDLHTLLYLQCLMHGRNMSMSMSHFYMRSKKHLSTLCDFTHEDFASMTCTQNSCYLTMSYFTDGSCLQHPHIAGILLKNTWKYILSCQCPLKDIMYAPHLYTQHKQLNT